MKAPIEVERLCEAQLYIPQTQTTLPGPDAVLVSNAERVVLASTAPPNEPYCVRTVVRRGRRVIGRGEIGGYLTDVFIDDDGTWIAGAYEGRLFASEDRGQSWQPFGRVRKCERIVSVLRFEDQLWVAGDVSLPKSPGLENRGLLVRRVGKSWRTIEIPGEVGSQRVERLVGLEGQLFALGSGVWRWDGRRMVADLAAALIEERRATQLIARGKGSLQVRRRDVLTNGQLDQTYKQPMRGLARTVAGTLVAVGGGSTIWRKPSDGDWAPVETQGWGENLQQILVLGELLVLFGSDAPTRQRHPLQVSVDDGLSFTPVDLSDLWSEGSHGLSFGGFSQAAPDGRDGIVAVAQGLAMIRVSTMRADKARAANKRSTKKRSTKKKSGR